MVLTKEHLTQQIAEYQNQITQMHVNINALNGAILALQWSLIELDKPEVSPPTPGE